MNDEQMFCSLSGYTALPCPLSFLLFQAALHKTFHLSSQYHMTQENYPAYFQCHYKLSQSISLISQIILDIYFLCFHFIMKGGTGLEMGIYY